MAIEELENRMVAVGFWCCWSELLFAEPRSDEENLFSKFILIPGLHRFCGFRLELWGRADDDCVSMDSHLPITYKVRVSRQSTGVGILLTSLTPIL